MPEQTKTAEFCYTYSSSHLLRTVVLFLEVLWCKLMLKASSLIEIENDSTEKYLLSPSV